MQLVQVGTYAEVKEEALKEGLDGVEEHFTELESSYSVEDDLQHRLHFFPVETALTVENDVPHLEYVGKREVGYTGGVPMKFFSEELDVYRYNGALFAEDVIHG